MTGVKIQKAYSACHKVPKTHSMSSNFLCSYSHPTFILPVIYLQRTTKYLQSKSARMFWPMDNFDSKMNLQRIQRIGQWQCFPEQCDCSFFDFSDLKEGGTSSQSYGGFSSLPFFILFCPKIHVLAYAGSCGLSPIIGCFIGFS